MTTLDMNGNPIPTQSLLSSPPSIGVGNSTQQSSNAANMVNAQNTQQQSLNPLQKQLQGNPGSNINPIITPGISMEQQALAGGKQQISNFMNALGQNPGVSNTNLTMGAPYTTNMPVQNIIDPSTAYQINTHVGQNNMSNNTYGQNTQTQNPYTQGQWTIANGQQLPTQQGMVGSNNFNNFSQLAPSYIGNTANWNANQANQNYNATALGNGNASGGYAGTAQGINPNTAYANPGNPLQGLNSGVIPSDEDLKTSIKPGIKPIDQFLSTINAHSYKYKNPELDGKGTFVSPMAQELEQTELGKSAVIETPRGKMVDYARLGGIGLAASAVLYREQQRLQDQVNELRKAFSLVKGKK